MPEVTQVSDRQRLPPLWSAFRGDKSGWWRLVLALSCRLSVRRVRGQPVPFCQPSPRWPHVTVPRALLRQGGGGQCDDSVRV